jgi:peptide/nickel transport system substrate-binding protein
MTSDQNGTEGGHSRRRFLRLGAGGALAGVAGCSGESGDTTTTTTTTEDGGGGGDGNDSDGGDGGDGGQTQRIDKTFTSHMWQVPQNVQFNPWNPKNQSGHLDGHLFFSLAHYNGVTQEWGNELAEDWSYEPEESRFRVTLRDDFKWHDGAPVTAGDIATQHRIDRFFSGSLWKYVESIDVPDETTLQYNLPGAVNSGLLLNSILPLDVRARESEYGEWLQRLNDAEGNDDELDSVKSELLGYQQEEGIGNNVWRLTERNQQSATLEPWDEQPGAEKINYRQLELLFRGENQSNWQGIKTGRQQLAQVAMPEEVRQGLPDSVVRYEWRAWFGAGLGFQYEDEVFGQRPVRQAIAYAVNSAPVAANAGAVGREAVTLPSGVPGPGRAAEYLGDVSSSFTNYEQNQERAARLLRDAGFTKEGGTWMRPNGNAFNVPIKVASGQSDTVAGIQTVVGQLQQFGINAEMVTVEGTALYGDTIPNGDFRVVATFWAQSQPYPYYNYEYVWSNNSNQQNAYHWPTEVSGIPAPFDAGNDPTTIPTKQLVGELAQAPEEQEQLDLTRRLAWAYNQDLPIYPLYHQDGGHFINGDGWDLPPKDLEGPASPQYDIQYWQIDHGFIKAQE